MQKVDFSHDAAQINSRLTLNKFHVSATFAFLRNAIFAILTLQNQRIIKRMLEITRNML